MSRTLRIHAPIIGYFDAVRRAGSIREAARRLNVASSAVNRQILKLEAEVGTPLFDRFSNGLRLTAAGEAFARHAISVLQDTERARSEIDALLGLQTGHVEIAAVEGVCLDLLPQLIGRMRETYARITFGVNVMGSASIAEYVIDGRADIGIAFGLQRNAELSQVALRSFRLGVIVAPGHPLAALSEVRLSMCADYPIILPKAGLSIRSYLDHHFQPGQGQARMVVESGSVELTKQLAQLGVGLGFQTRIGLNNELKDGALVYIPLKQKAPITSELGVYVRAKRNTPVAVDAFLNILAGELERLEKDDVASNQGRGS